MTEIQNYQIIEAGCPSILVERVKTELKQNWRPLGAPFVADPSNRDTPDYFQAMTKEGDCL